MAPARDPEFKGIVERANQYLETSFLPGRIFTSPADFNAQVTEWLAQTANRRLVRATGTRPAEAFTTDFQAMTILPPLAPITGLRTRVRLGRDYYVRVDGNDYTIDPRVIGKFIDITATPMTMTAHLRWEPGRLPSPLVGQAHQRHRPAAPGGRPAPARALPPASSTTAAPR